MLDRVLTTGFVIVDANSADGRMFVQFYSYWYGVPHSPIFELARADDPIWYPDVRQYEKAWEDSEPYQLPA